MSGFDDDFLVNPFDDASIKSVTSQAPVVKESMDSYDPFKPEHLEGMSSSSKNVVNVNNLGNMPAVMQATEQPPHYSRSNHQTSTGAGNPGAAAPTVEELQKYKEELDRKAQLLNEKERQLENVSSSPPKDNWPPLPEGFCVQPCFYIDIDKEIGSEFQDIVRRLYHLWIVQTGLLILNVFGTFCMFVNDVSFIPFVVSIVYLALFAPLSFLCWFRPVYKAFRNDSSFQFMVFFFVFFFQFLTTTFMAVGVLGSGACGIVQAISLLRTAGVGNIIVGIIVLTIALGFAAAAAIELFLLAKMLKIYRGSEASMQKARDEFTNNIIRNENVRNVVRDASAATIRSQMATTDNRY